MTKRELIDNLCDKLAVNYETLLYSRPHSRQKYQLKRKNEQLIKEIRVCESYPYELDEELPDCLIFD